MGRIKMQTGMLIANENIGGGSDVTNPSCSLSITGIVAGVAAVVVTFSEAVVGFVVGGITISGGSLAGFATADDIVFTVNWTLPAGIIATIDVAAGVCTDTAGNVNTAATQVTAGYQIPYSPSKDTYLRLDTADRNFGIAPDLGYLYSNYPFLMEFNLSTIPSSATCVDAQLKLTRIGTGTSQSITVNIYSILSGNAGWFEGTKNNNVGVAGDSCALYKNQDPTSLVSWAGSAGLGTAGVDYNATPIGSFSANRSDAVGTVYSASLNTAVVKSWFGTLNSNYGIKCINSTANSGERLASKENATPSYRPRIEITFFT